MPSSIVRGFSRMKNGGEAKKGAEQKCRVTFLDSRTCSSPRIRWTRFIHVSSNGIYHIQGTSCEDGYVRVCGILSTVIAGHLPEYCTFAMALTAVALIGPVCHPAALRWLIVGLASVENAR